MTEAEWLAATDPHAMATSPIMHPFWGDANCAEVARSKRKRELCCIVWLRRVWDLLVSEHSRRYVAVVERYIEGQATEQEVEEACWMAKDAGEDPAVNTDAKCWATQAAYDIGGLAETIQWLSLCSDETRQPLVVNAILAGTLLDVFGNPFHPVAFDSSWRTEAVVALARGMYESRDFGPMPVLADALDDAGCGDADVLAHCRGPGPHVRGCWVVDLVLGKS